MQLQHRNPGSCRLSARLRGYAFGAACVLIAWLSIAANGACSPPPAGVPVPLTDGRAGAGFDDLRYSAALQRVLVPGARTGSLWLVDPTTLARSRVAGFSAAAAYAGGHDFGATSVDEGRGLLFVTDRTARRVSVVDTKTRSIVAGAKLAAEPDYVRYVAATGELWVTEPAASQIEILSLPKGAPPNPVPQATIAVKDGPESLVIDPLLGRAYTHRWHSASLAIDLRTRSIVADWPNGCAGSRGIAFDERSGFLFVACREGKVSVLDTRHGGRVLSSITHGGGFDVIGYNPALHHLYLAGSSCSCVVMLGVSRAGVLAYLGSHAGPASSHCAVADDHAHAFVCDPAAGRLLRLDDPYPATQ